MLQGGYKAVLEARSQEEFSHEIGNFTRAMGFERFSAMTVVDHTLGRSEFITIDNCPPGFKETWNDPRLGMSDPVMQHCKSQSVPIVWDQRTYVDHGAGELWESQARYGYRTGVCLALHLPEGRHFLLGMNRNEVLPADSIELIRLVADMQLFAVHALDAALRLLLPVELQLEQPRLRPRELEVLRWTMDGKTAWEVGGILSITERTVVLHLQSAMHKLDCKSKHQAVLKALRLGLIR